MRRHPVVEVFGPTVQGEGIDQGLPVHFVRLGGCDYRCSWCDTPHAVLPERVRQAPRLTSEEIVARVDALAGAPRWVVVSGGNPALHQLDDLVERFHAAGYRVAVETQGSQWRPWLERCDRLCLSPKPPSSGMEAGEIVHEQIARAAKLAAERERGWAFVKVVVFDEADYAFARDIHLRSPQLPFYLSAGNDAGQTVAAPDRVDRRSVAEVRDDLLRQSLWLVDKVLADDAMRDAQVQSQYHVLLWGNTQGK
ncbi:MAG TPA: 7-carboxy-7-deazaguanine synthase QueE [Conexibacter sp.]|jgi:7-carboxy-7-deazaguanine synthase